jgi:hypothetical protein
MKTKRILIAVSVLLVAVAALLFANYDKTKVVLVMRENRTLVAKTQTALGSSDFAAAEESFTRFAENMASIKEYTPNKGTKEEWDKVLSGFVEAAKKGAEASSAKDAQKANEALQQLLAYNKEGHSKFK